MRNNTISLEELSIRFLSLSLIMSLVFKEIDINNDFYKSKFLSLLILVQCFVYSIVIAEKNHNNT